MWYDPEGYHSLPAYLNSLNNFLLRVNMSKYDAARHGKVTYTKASPVASFVTLPIKCTLYLLPPSGGNFTASKSQVFKRNLEVVTSARWNILDNSLNFRLI